MEPSDRLKPGRCGSLFQAPFPDVLAGLLSYWASGLPYNWVEASRGVHSEKCRTEKTQNWWANGSTANCAGKVEDPKGEAKTLPRPSWAFVSHS